MKIFNSKHTFFFATILFFSASCHFFEPFVIIPEAPTALHVTVASNEEIDLFWTDNATNETGYKIQRKTSGTNFIEIGSVVANVTTYSDNSALPNITYTYRVYAINSAGNSILPSNEDSATIVIATVTLPEVTTNPITAIDTMHATSGGDVINDGGATVTVRGVCWSLTANPTVDLPTKTIDGNGTGSFSSSISGLSPNTSYHVRAYATNSAGTAYGSDVMFTSQPIPVPLCGITIGGITWSCKNLDVAYYSNGDPIPQITDPAEWQNATTGAWCWYNNDSSNYGAKYGRLYNFYAVSDPRGLAPAGWHIATDDEWSRLVKFIDPSADTACDYCTSSTSAGGALKTIGYLYWYSPNTGASNSYNFSALPGGYRTELGTFSLAGHQAMWWTSHEFDTWRAYYRYVYYADTRASRYNIDKHYGNSIRLVKN